MRGHPGEIEQVLTALTGDVAGRLAAGGWHRRIFDDDDTDATLTRETRNGVIAVVGIHRTSFRWPDDWPIEIETWLGVGYEPALDLMPLLTLDPVAALVGELEDGGENSFVIELTSAAGAARAAERIASFVDAHASALAQRFPDAAAIDEQLRRDVEAESCVDDENDDAGASDAVIQLRLVVLAAMGKFDEARALLATYPTEQPDGGVDRDDRRFVRQLERWLDAGGPLPPPVEQTLARLPRRAGPQRPSWSDARADANAKKEALDSVRARSKGKRLDELKDLIAAEYSARGLEIAPSVIGHKAELLQTEQQPFGRARNALKAFQMLKGGGGDIIRMIKHDTDEDPQWLRPPDRAAYPMIAARHRYTAIDLDAQARGWLERVRVEAPRRIGPWAHIDIWLCKGESGGLIEAHIGERLVGTIAPGVADEFIDVMSAAALFDEDAVVRGRLTTGDSAAAVVLEIPLPERPETVAAPD